MLDQRYVNYIKMKLDSGSTREQITEELTKNGWTTEQVDSVFQNYDAYKIEEDQKVSKAKNSSKVPPPKKSQLYEGQLNQVNAQLIPQEKDPTVFFKWIIWIIAILVIVGGGYYLYTTDNVVERVFGELFTLIEQYTPIDIPHFERQ